MSDGAQDRSWSVYLAGEIHSDWRERIEAGVREAGLPVSFSAPVTDHAASDDAGTGTLGEESEPFWRDHNSATARRSGADDPSARSGAFRVVAGCGDLQAADERVSQNDAPAQRVHAPHNAGCVRSPRVSRGRVASGRGA